MLTNERDAALDIQTNFKATKKVKKRRNETFNKLRKIIVDVKTIN